MNSSVRFCIPFGELALDEVSVVGARRVVHPELVGILAPPCVRIPAGFAVTADGCRAVLTQAQVMARLSVVFSGLKPEDLDGLTHRASAARAIVRDAGLPSGLAGEIREAYSALSILDVPEVAVHSSVSAEDLRGYPDDGQQETFMKVRGEEALLEACLLCYASLFSARAIRYRAMHGFDHTHARLSVGVQRVDQSDHTCAAVMLTLHPETGVSDVMHIVGACGRPEPVLRDALSGEPPIWGPAVRGAADGEQAGAMCKLHDAEHDKGRLQLTHDDALILARWAAQIRTRYPSRIGRLTPFDVGWARDGFASELFWVQGAVATEAADLDGHEFLAPVTAETQGVLIAREISDDGGGARGDDLVAVMTELDHALLARNGSVILSEGDGFASPASVVTQAIFTPGMMMRDGLLCPGILRFKRTVNELNDIYDLADHLGIDIRTLLY